MSSLFNRNNTQSNHGVPELRERLVAYKTRKSILPTATRHDVSPDEYGLDDRLFNHELQLGTFDVTKFK